MKAKEHLISYINKELRGTITHDEQEDLRLLLRDDEGARYLYQYLKEKSPLMENSNEDILFDRIWKKVEYFEQISPITIPEPQITESRSFTSWLHILKKQSRWVAAACLLFVLGVGFIYYFANGEYNKEQTFISNRGEKKKNQLPDGTLVWLNSDSKVFVSKDFGRFKREVRLEGEAFFDVAKDKDHPFTVSYGETEVEVLGTKFNIRAYPDEIRTAASLVEGSIALKVDKQSDEVLTMVPGQRLEITKTADRGPRFELIENTVTDNTASVASGKEMPSEVLWKENILSFNEDPLELVVSKLSKWYNVSIEIKNKERINMKFSGVMEGYSLNQVLNILKTAEPSLKINKENNGISIY